jgi:hypothetical protein
MILIYLYCTPGRAPAPPFICWRRFRHGAKPVILKIEFT